jgi:ATP-dependent DNA ligase
MQLLDQLKANSSPSAKQAILANAKSSLLVKELLAYTYSPYKHFGVKFHTNLINEKAIGNPQGSMFEILDQLYCRSITGEAARKKVMSYAAQHGSLIMLVCNKDLDCGISAATINKAFGYELIPTFKVQLAKEADIDKVVFPVLAQLKYNGTRCVTIIANGEVVFKTRNGHSFLFPQLEAIIKAMPNIASVSAILDGELTFGDSCNEDHTKISGLVNSARLGTPIPEGRGIRYNVFDTMSYECFASSYCNEVYSLRWAEVLKIVDTIKSPMVVAATSWLFKDKEVLLTHYNELLKKGYEGLILKTLNHTYKFKRSSEWAKMKATLSADLRCTECVAGEGKYNNAIGALRCEGYLTDSTHKVHIEVHVGSGLTDYDRSLREDTYLGKIIEIKYNKIIYSKATNTYSLFLPRFVCIREDK